MTFTGISSTKVALYSLLDFCGTESKSDRDGGDFYR